MSINDNNEFTPEQLRPGFSMRAGDQDLGTAAVKFIPSGAIGFVSAGGGRLVAACPALSGTLNKQDIVDPVQLYYSQKLDALKKIMKGDPATFTGPSEPADMSLPVWSFSPASRVAYFLTLDSGQKIYPDSGGNVALIHDGNISVDGLTISSWSVAKVDIPFFDLHRSILGSADAMTHQLQIRSINAFRLLDALRDIGLDIELRSPYGDCFRPHIGSLGDFIYVRLAFQNTTEHAVPANAVQVLVSFEIEVEASDAPGTTVFVPAYPDMPGEYGQRPEECNSENAHAQALFRSTAEAPGSQSALLVKGETPNSFVLYNKVEMKPWTASYPGDVLYMDGVWLVPVRSLVRYALPEDSDCPTALQKRARYKITVENHSQQCILPCSVNKVVEYLEM